MAVTGRIAPGELKDAARRSGLPWSSDSGGFALPPPARVVPPGTQPETVDIVLPKIDTPMVSANGSLSIPWYQMIINMCAYMQPTGISAGEYQGITFDSFGKATNASSSGATIQSPVLNSPTLNEATANDIYMNGEVTAPTPPASDNSTTVATTAYVQSEGFLKGNQNINVSGDATGTGTTSIVLAVIRLQGRPVSAGAPASGNGLVWDGSAWAPAPVVGEAPSDGRFYARQNGAWVAITATPA